MGVILFASSCHSRFFDAHGPFAIYNVLTYLQFCTRRETSLHGPINNLHCLEKLIVMLLGRNDLNTKRRVQVHTPINRFLIP